MVNNDVLLLILTCNFVSMIIGNYSILESCWQMGDPFVEVTEEYK
jgi:hypothetical protein